MKPNSKLLLFYFLLLLLLPPSPGYGVAEDSNSTKTSFQTAIQQLKDLRANLLALKRLSEKQKQLVDTLETSLRESELSVIRLSRNLELSEQQLRDLELELSRATDSLTKASESLTSLSIALTTWKVFAYGSSAVAVVLLAVVIIQALLCPA